MLKRPSAPLLSALLLSACPTTPGTETDTDTGTTPGTTPGTTTEPTTGSEEDPPLELDADGCVPKCIKDVAAATPKIDAECTVCDYHPVEGTCEPMAECDEVLGEWKLPAGESACFVARTDRDFGTPSPLDDLSDACIDRGSNADIFVLRSGEPPAGAVLAVSCTWSDIPAKDCPGLASD